MRILIIALTTLALLSSVGSVHAVSAAKCLCISTDRQIPTKGQWMNLDRENRFVLPDSTKGEFDACDAARITRHSTCNAVAQNTITTCCGSPNSLANYGQSSVRSFIAFTLITVLVSTISILIKRRMGHEHRRATLILYRALISLSGGLSVLLAAHLILSGGSLWKVMRHLDPDIHHYIHISIPLILIFWQLWGMTGMERVWSRIWSRGSR